MYVMQVCEVLGGRNWVQDIDENKPPFLRDGTEGGNRLDQLPLEDVLEKAERVIEVRFFFLFCRSLAPKAERVIEVLGCAFSFLFFTTFCFFYSLLFSPFQDGIHSTQRNAVMRVRRETV